MPAQRVRFGTSGHRGSAFECSFNEAHVLAITQAICAYRKHKDIDGPLFLGFDTHALSAPAFASALEVLRLKVSAASGWFAVRPSGTEDIYRIYAESFLGSDHLHRIVEQAQSIVRAALAAAPERGDECASSSHEASDRGTGTVRNAGGSD